VGLEYAGESLVNSGIPVQAVDLCWEDEWREALGAALSRQEPLAVGITFRNIDDCSSMTRTSFLPWIEQLVRAVREHTDSPVVLGGVGFSIAPAPIVRRSGAHYGVAGDGEETLPALARCLQEGQSAEQLPNLVFRCQGTVVENPPRPAALDSLPAYSRRLFDNARYQARGAMVGIETKRGCPQECIYCPEPAIRGRTVRLRPPRAVAQEMVNLVEQGASWFHLCDSEFNIPISHAKDLCRAIIDAGLADRVHWYPYCAPVPFDEELVRLMARAGCAGVNFGVDSLCDEQLQALGRRHRLTDLQRLVSWLRQAGLTFIFDLLLGGHGETPETVRRTARAAEELEVPLLGVAEGMRVYPNTPLYGLLKQQQPELPEDLLEPTFYFSPDLGSDPVGEIRQILGDDPRYLLLARPGEQRSYNYVGDDWLSDAIAGGARGAYWDIIRRRNQPGGD
jgi:radical SAM superfamily enzyme YgiQ (UPF0313 family)